MTKRFYDNTMLSSYKECPRKYFIRQVLGWRSAGTSLPLIFGLSWHSGMDVVWQYAKQAEPGELPRLAMAKFLETWEEEGQPAELDVSQVAQYEPRTPGIAHEMYANYVEQRSKMMQSCELIACEQPFAVPMPGLTDVWYIGRLDKVIVYNGQTLVIEHKTTSEYKVDGGFKTQYIESWYSDSQVKGYQFGGGLFFPGLTQVWVDAALVHKKVHDKFRFVPVQHQTPLLEEWIGGTREWISRLEFDQKEYDSTGLTPDTFPKNENSCMGKYGACPFLNICRTTPDPSKLAGPPEGYIIDRWEPFNLLGIDKILGDNGGKEQSATDSSTPG